MAYTVTRTKSAMGDQRVEILNITADAATQTVSTTLAHINAISVAMLSCSTGTALPHLSINSNASGVATEGSIGISGVTSGDAFIIICYGR